MQEAFELEEKGKKKQGDVAYILNIKSHLYN